METALYSKGRENMKRKALLIVVAVFMTLLMGTCLAHAAEMTYDEATHTYTLNNTTLTAPIILEADSTIIVKGDCAIEYSGPCIASAETGDAIQDYSVTIKGGGTLDVMGFIYANDFTLTEGTKVTLGTGTGDFPGLMALGNITITDSELKVLRGQINAAGTQNNTYTNATLEVNGMPGIMLSGNTVMTDCDVTVNNSMFHVRNGTLTITGGNYYINQTYGAPGFNCSEVNTTIKGANIRTKAFSVFSSLEMIDTEFETVDYAASSPAIMTYGTGANCTISNSKLNMSGSNLPWGIYANGNVVINDSTDLVVDANTGGVYGANITIAHSKVEISVPDTGASFGGVLMARVQVYNPGISGYNNEPGTITLTDVKVKTPAEYTFGNHPSYQALAMLDKSGGVVSKLSIDIEHKWDAGKVTKPATATAEGIKTYTCTICGETKTEAIPKTGGSDGTAFGPGADASAAEAAILALKDDKDPKGTAFGILQLKASKITKSSIKLTWKKAPGAKKYIIYSNACGKGKKYQKLTTVTGKSTTIKKVAGKKLAKGKYYKFLMVAVDANNKVVSTSKTVHAATTGGKVGNPTKVTTKAKKNKVTVKVKKTFKLAGKQVGKKVKKHRAVSYETSNAKIATVSKKGVIKGVKKGTCKVYAYAQNGVCAVIKVTVK